MLDPLTIVQKSIQRKLDLDYTDVRKIFRDHDESHLFPVLGRFNVTERAIRRVRRLEKDGLCVGSPLEYAHILDQHLREIVNAQV